MRRIAPHPRETSMPKSFESWTTATFPEADSNGNYVLKGSLGSLTLKASQIGNLDPIIEDEQVTGDTGAN